MQNPVKRVAAVHDLSGFGRASLTVVIPILSTMGMQVCPLPTAVLSTHSKFSDYRFIDLTEYLEDYIRHWKDLNIQFDAIYSGFLGSPRQINLVADFMEYFSHKDQFIVVDPVLGDDGALYGPLGEDMVREMQFLVTKADVITPNLTEAALLLNRPYNPQISEAEMKEWIYELSDKGPGVVIVTSVPEIEQGKETSVIAYDKKGEIFWKVLCEYMPANYPGTGDAFTSVIVGSLLQGDSLPIALDRAVQFISLGVRATFGYLHNANEGILLERILSSLQSSVRLSSYQILD